MKVIRQSRRDDEPAGRALFAWSFSETRRVSTLPAIDKYVNPSFVAGRGINISAEIGRSGEYPRAIPRPTSTPCLKWTAPPAALHWSRIELTCSPYIPRVR